VSVSDLLQPAFPPLYHPLVVDPQTSSATPYRFEPH
jgi:hypothetical protein